MLAPLAREVRLIAVAWLALRGTQPRDRPEILWALMATHHATVPVGHDLEGNPSALKQRE
jgi:hypothetical protein